MLYSFIYLGAFWDPYGNLDSVPVAFVDLDKSVTKADKQYNLGKDIEKNLKDGKKVKWDFVDLATAEKGVKDTSYYAMIVIPEDFSKKIADAKDGQFNKPEIQYEANAGKNYIFSQISERIADSVKAEVTTNIVKETSKSLVDSLVEVKNSLKDAEDGAGKLYDGSGKLIDGSSQVSNGLTQATNGSSLLYTGLNQVADGEKKTTAGADALINGLNQVKASFQQSNPALGQLNDGAQALYEGVSKLNEGVISANTNLNAGLTTASKGVSDVSTAINQAQALLNASQADIKNNTLNAEDIKNIMTALGTLTYVQSKHIDETIAAPLKAAASSTQPLVDNMSILKTKTKQLADGTNMLITGINGNTTKALGALNQLLQGAEQIKAGNVQLTQAVTTAASKTGELNSGLEALSKGENDLTGGLKDVGSGTDTLKSGLITGYDKMSSNIKFNSEDMSKFVSEPIVIKDTTINTIKFYGEGLAPYFLSLSLWLGAMLINLILSIVKITDVFKSRFLKTLLGKYTLGAALVSTQAIILSVALVKGLNLHSVNTVYFFLDNILLSIVFFSIMFGLAAAIGIFSTPIVFVAFIIQLASCGGTFPVETAPAFYRAVNPFLPMTYSVKVLRMIISGINSTSLLNNLLALIAFMVIFLAAGFGISIIKNKINKKNEDKVELVA
jgi:putative membrane protein